MSRLIVIGASAGGVAALRALVAGLPVDLPAAVLVVLHIGSHRSRLPEILNASGPLPASHAADGEPPRPGHIHVAPPDRHLVVAGERMRLLHGAKEHHTRPAIDPLFRTAALSLGARVIGVVLSGCMDDGTAGLQAIAARGGTTVVQEPGDAQEPSMPQSALRHVAIDHRATAAAMAPLLNRLARTEELAPMNTADSTIEHEVALMLGQGDALEHLRHVGRPTTFTCPECHGTLWQVEASRPLRYRCHTGHGFTARTLEHAMSLASSDALWNALRTLQERWLLLAALAGPRVENAAADAVDAVEHARLLQLQQRLLDEVDQLRRMIHDSPADEAME